jgi:hypothetical protein
MGKGSREWYSIAMKRTVMVLLAISSLVEAGSTGNRVLYVGGTVAGVPARSDAHIELFENDSLKLNTRNNSFLVPYKDINTLEYGMRVSRRYMEAVLISPVFLVAKRRTHFLTIGYSDAEGKQQAMVLQVGKDEIRPLLVSLEARTGRRVEYQDEEARKAGKG